VIQTDRILDAGRKLARYDSLQRRTRRVGVGIRARVRAVADSGDGSVRHRGGGGGGFAGLNFLSTIGFNVAFGGFGGGGGGSVVPPGDYIVSMTVGGRTMRQKVRVERGPAVGLPPAVTGTNGQRQN